MAPLPPNSTMRIWLDYTSGGIQHSLQTRFLGDDPSTVGITQRLTALGDALQGVMSDEDTIVGWRYSLALSNFSFPFEGPVGGAGLLAGGVVNPESQACFVASSGRSTGGRRVRMTVFTVAATGFTAYRLTRSGLAANFQELFDVLTDAIGTPGEDQVAVDGNPVLWNQYLNIGQNAYWQRESRS